MNKDDLDKTISFIHDKLKRESEVIPLYEPKFLVKEKEYIFNVFDPVVFPQLVNMFISSKQ